LFVDRREFLKKGALLFGAILLCPAKVIEGLPTPSLIGDDFMVSATGDIRWVGGSDPTYTVAELYRWLSRQFDMEAILMPGSNEHLLQLNDPYNVDDEAVRFLREGAIIQESGEVIYIGMVDW
jgi:hypothetical protein